MNAPTTPNTDDDGTDVMRGDTTTRLVTITPTSKEGWA